MNQFSTEDQTAPKTRSHRPWSRALLSISGVLVIGAIAAACSSSSATPTTTSQGAGGGGTTATLVSTTNNATLGTILVNNKGFTLYTLSGNAPCDAACSAIWPPLLVTGSASPNLGSVAGLGTVMVSGGEQVTYNGMRLYTFVRGQECRAGQRSRSEGHMGHVVRGHNPGLDDPDDPDHRSQHDDDDGRRRGRWGRVLAFASKKGSWATVSGPMRSLILPGLLGDTWDAAAERQPGGLTSRLYVPAFSIVMIAAVLVAIGWSSRWGGTSFTSAMTSLRVVVVGPATLAFLAVFLVVERLRPAQRRPIFARGYRQDLLYTVLNATLVAPLVVALSLSFAEVVRRSLPWIVVPHIGFVPSWAVITLIFIAMDGCNWLAHLANHRIRTFWRFHELHHSQEDMSVLTVFRTHPLIHVSYLITLIPGIVLIANGAVPITLLVAYAAFVAFEHSNTNLGFGPLGRIFVSPNYHRIHHKLDGPPGCEPRLRADDLGPDGSPGGISYGGDDPNGYRTSRPTARGRTGDRPTTSSQGAPRPTRRAVPPS